MLPYICIFSLHANISNIQCFMIKKSEFRYGNANATPNLGENVFNEDISITIDKFIFIVLSLTGPI